MKAAAASTELRPVWEPEARNGRGAFPEWVRRLKGKSGVYIIARKSDEMVLYVGESHTGKLFETFTRHFQAWSGETASPTYERKDLVAALARVVPASKAQAEQYRLIKKWEPRDNDLDCSSQGCLTKYYVSAARSKARERSAPQRRTAAARARTQPRAARRAPAPAARARAPKRTPAKKPPKRKARR